MPRHILWGDRRGNPQECLIFESDPPPRLLVFVTLLCVVRLVHSTWLPTNKCCIGQDAQPFYVYSWLRILQIVIKKILKFEHRR